MIDNETYEEVDLRQFNCYDQVQTENSDKIIEPGNNYVHMI